MENKIYTYNRLNKYRVQRGISKSFKYILLTGISVVYMIPILWMISTSLKARADIFAWPPMLLPEIPRWENYRIAFQSFPLLRFMGNSMFLVFVNICGELLSVPLIAYGFARLRFPARNFLF
ncbi:MAG: carbohydrate ABC transporter permease, partial [Spirochaetales bacterium]|nr:carbohydrate ABC transporter permease [Spirochaetales bacterium]